MFVESVVLSSEESGGVGRSFTFRQRLMHEPDLLRREPDLVEIHNFGADFSRFQLGCETGEDAAQIPIDRDTVLSNRAEDRQGMRLRGGILPGGLRQSHASRLNER